MSDRWPEQLMLSAVVGMSIVIAASLTASSRLHQESLGGTVNVGATRAASSTWQRVLPPEGWHILSFGRGFEDLDTTIDGSVWLAAQHGGVFRMGAESSQVYGVDTFTRTLRGISMVSPTDGWIAGDDGVPLRFTGERWERAQSPVMDNLRATLMDVDMVSESDGWMCIDKANIIPPIESNMLRFDGDRWSFHDFPATDNCFTIHMLSQSYGWVGGSGSLSRFDGVSWASMPSPVEGLISSIDIISPSDVWAVAGRNFLHFNGEEWLVIPNPSNKEMTAIDFVSPNEGWAVGAAIMHYSEGEWTEVESPVELDLEKQYLLRLKMISAAEGWAVGTLGLILHYSTDNGGGPGLAERFDYSANLPWVGAHAD